MEIDGVFSGGGIKGFALIGAYAEMEKRGLRFKRVAGTSAGSIVAALIAAGYSAHEMFHLLGETDLSKFLDPRKNMIPFPFAKWISVYWRLGLYKGNELERWLKDTLEAKGVKTFSDVPPQSLRFIASDLTNGRLLVLPDDLEKYGISAGSFSIAKAIRMSCSLPYFFEPVKLRTRNGMNIIVDGGVLSNFPMWLFDRENVNKVRPVLGIKLSHHINEKPRKEIHNAIKMFEALFETMKDAHDARYISKKHAKNIIFIPTKGIIMTEFHLSKERKQALFELGREHAHEFLKTWAY
jgi:NTE family protein